MEELNIIVNQSQGEITTNFDEVEKALILQMSAYKDFVVSENELDIAKGDLAFLRRLRKSIEERRKEIKNSFLTPYNNFEESCKKLTAIIDEPIETIDKQLKMFEQERKDKKRERIKKLYEETVADLLPYLPFEENYNPKWDNKTYSNNDILFDISQLMTKVHGDLVVIRALNSEIEDELIKTYIANGNDVTKAVERNSQYLADKQKIEARIDTAKTDAPITQEVIDTTDTIKTVRFVVSDKDAEAVRDFLELSEITYREE